MVYWDSATARSGVLSSRYSSVVCCPRASHIPAAGRSAGAWSAGGIEAISPIISTRSMRSLRPGAGQSSLEGLYAG